MAEIAQRDSLWAVRKQAFGSNQSSQNAGVWWKVDAPVVKRKRWGPPGVQVARTAPTFRHGASVPRFDYFVVHRAVACQILEVRVLEESRISPHHPVQVS